MNKEKPESCAACNFFNSAIYGRCILKGTWYGVEDGEWIHVHRPNWCPLDKDGKSNGNADCGSEP